MSFLFSMHIGVEKLVICWCLFVMSSFGEKTEEAPRPRPKPTDKLELSDKTF